ncbi:MAG: restriction endonuclease [Bacteroidetes bacterium]|nr:restriction endonuclease [Bacteroidota bacterium]
MNIEKYRPLLAKAIKLFWETRDSQRNAETGRQIKEAGNRRAVTGGKQLDGLLQLLYIVAVDVGIPSDCIYIKGNRLPGFFRPTKNWDMLIISPTRKLVAVIELKSQVGSFGNNFNNRTEEALGSATDLWTAYRDKAFPNQNAPWLGYLMVIEKSQRSTSKIKIDEPFFPVFKEFKNTSYIDRYQLLCEKLMLERLYTQCCLIWVTNDHQFGDVARELSVEAFLYSFIGHLSGQLHEFKNNI